MNRKFVFWIAVPAITLGIIAGGVLALPGIVSSYNHRSTIEALASSLTGRNVHIAGDLSLSLFPQPQLIAGNITIDGPQGETIKAKSLTLDIAMPALFRGQLTASSLMLQSPMIALPWPLPGGPGAVAPQPWLTALHAQIDNGRISIGGASFTGVSADIFTGNDGAVSISGNGLLFNQPIDLTISLGAPDPAGQAQLAAELKSGQSLMHFSGIFSTSNVISGTLSASNLGRAWLTTDPNIKTTISATLNADPDDIGLDSLSIVQGGGQLGGSVRFHLANSSLDAKLTGANINWPADLPQTYHRLFSQLTVHDDISINELTIGGIVLPHLEEISDISGQGVKIINSRAVLPGAGSASLTGAIDQSGYMKAQAHVNLSTASTPIDVTSAVTGTLDRLSFGNINGTMAGSNLSGNAIVTIGDAVSINSQWHFKQLDLGLFGHSLRDIALTSWISGNFEVAADHANLAHLAMTHLMIDGGFNNNLTIRHLTASLYDGVVAGNVTVLADGTVTAGHAFLAIPSARPLAAFLPARPNLPVAVLDAPLALSVSAAGPHAALATSAAGALGQFTVSASPVINLDQFSAIGAMTLRHPSAIAAFKLFGINAGLPWPGAGSISIRSDMNLTNRAFGFPNFVLSMGDLTATGTMIMSSSGAVNGDINADTLALPPIPTDLSAFWNILPTLNGNIAISANRVLLNGIEWLGPSSGNILLQPAKASLSFKAASMNGGTVNGGIALSQTAPQPPALAVTVNLQQADFSQFDIPLVFPVTFPSGIGNMSVSAAATGFSPQTWLATLTGNMTLQAQNGTLSGFNLASMQAALTAPNRAACLKAAAQAGITDFQALTVAGDFDHGVFKLAHASMQGQAGSATATGTIDLSDQDLALNFGLQPKVAPPLNIGLSIIGGWSNPRKVPMLKSALSWTPAH